MLKRLIHDLLGRKAPAAPVTTQAKPSYDAAYFAAQDVDDAKRIILNSFGDTTTDDRWKRETPFLADEIGRELGLSSNACVLDYGCGIGRLAKTLITRYGCSVVGVDISAPMREMAPQYVDSPLFEALSPETFDARVKSGLRVTHALSCWVLQHCEDVETDIRRIESSLANGGTLFVLNAYRRCLPTQDGWVDDGLSISDLLASRLEPLKKYAMPEAGTTPAIAASAFIMILRKRV